ncbi:methionyl-tRNA synthetase [Saccharicrinis carchari]|uniref:Methionine--tRNA ligase n=1 Tax=Saccharicrinis carchari TaxID=1168039 RepID=A0A521EV49_SACCC|nr:methionine--tRNA ligase [Saccharicrinis carchari]SMO87806.1 methionyl-tRNA synthetase [Saccharicrinis carchari]
MNDFKRTLITTALPYANGPIHIGHLAGVYVPADIYARYLRMKGEDVLLIGGSDEHGVPITLKAKNEGLKPQDIVDRYHDIIKKSFEDFGVSFDVYSRTTSETHYKTASDFFKTIYDKGGFVENESDQFYDPEAKQFLADRYITGSCPHCGNDGAYGDQCESCGSSLNANDLKNPVSVITGSVPILKRTKHWYLPLDKHEPFLKKWILEEHKEWKSNVYGQCKSWLDQGLQERAVSRDLDWGVPVPVDGADGKVLYVWFDAPIGYISATKELTPDWEKYWKDPETRLLHFIGKDNIVFHCIMFPAMLKAEGSFNLPDNVPANEFLNLEGDKISTSRNWAVWLHEYLEDFKGQEDSLRYSLCANAPETKDNDFTWKDFQARNNNELVAILGNFVNRTMVLTHKYFNGKVPTMGKVVDSFDKESLAQIEVIAKKVQASLDNFRFREAVKEMMNLARLGNKYLADTEPWKVIKTDEERVKTILFVSLQITANLSVLMEPFLPFSALRLQAMLNLPGSSWDALGKTDLIAPEHGINQPELLFSKIEDETIQQQLDKLQASKTDNQSAKKMAEPAKENISFEDFSQMDIRIGTIKSAEKVAKTKKLLKLEVDTGIDTRTVVSGIAEFYNPDDIVGKQVNILVNLAPRKIKGIESQGMILMAQDANGELVFVAPSKKMKPGSEVR